MTMTATNVDTLRQGWEDAAATLAPGVDELRILLETRLTEAVREDRLDESSLLSVVDEAWRVAAKQVDQGQAVHLARRLQQAVYEYLLSLDAIVEPVEEPPPTDTARPRPGSPLIGAEEVASLPAATPVAPEPKVEAPAAIEPSLLAPEERPAPGPEATAPRVEAEAPAEVMETPVSIPEEPAPVAEAPASLPEPAAPAAPLHAPAPVAATEPELAAEAEPPAEPEPEPAAEPPRRRFTLFRRGGPVTSADEEEPEPAPAPAAENPLEAPAASAPVELEDLRTVPLDDDEEAPAPPAHFVAPKDGFHLTEFRQPPATPPAAAVPAPPEPAPVPEPPPIMRAAEPLPAEAPAASGSRGWRIRNLRGTKRPKEDEDAVELEIEADADGEGEDLSVAQSDSRFDTDPEVLGARRQINDRLRHRRCDEAASLLQRLATDVGGREVAELALDAGDRCRALGKSNAALSCYLAASRADPVHETPLLRLADICIDDKDIDLAASYLERVARLHRLRGDRRGALRVYRKIATVAPYRDDILNLLMHVQATGRFEDE